MSQLPPQLTKHNSWSPESDREEAWLRRKTLHNDRRRNGRLSHSVTDEDLDELRACIDLGFAFDLSLADTFPALDLYYAVNRQYEQGLGSGSQPSDSSSGCSTPPSIYSPGDCPEKAKARLKQWAQIVACSVRQR